MVKIEDYIRDIQDFPEEGILFKDITPLLNHPEALQAMKEKLLALVGDQQVDKVVGIESRGFFLGTLLAQELNAGFVPVRKKGKLPYTSVQETYELEYGIDTLEIHQDAISKGEKVLIHDDVLATGGTAKAVCNLVEKLGGEILQCNFMMKLDFLKGADKLQPHTVAAVLSY
ncbi:MAG: adenine phosphoribosyltransferase [Flavobacteriaceae bacterium]|nr:adenine phosphoribosyltransferase [Flavobacteriaceae bacterium]